MNSAQYSQLFTAGAPTLLEDGQRYRGNQLKQSLDGWEVVRLTGKDVHHLKKQGVKSESGCEEAAGDERLLNLLLLQLLCSSGQTHFRTKDNFIGDI